MMIARRWCFMCLLTCSENWMTYATPQWVKDAGAKGTFYRYGKGRVDNGGCWDPLFDEPVFIKKLDAFLAAYAARYGGNPNVECIDVGTYGLWGEGHTHASSQQDFIEIKKRHIDLHLKHFKKTLLCISDDFAGHNKPGKRFPIRDYRHKKFGTAYRLDQQGNILKTWDPYFIDIEESGLLSPWGAINLERGFPITIPSHYADRHVPACSPVNTQPRTACGAAQGNNRSEHRATVASNVT